MLEVIEKLLILQERDRSILRVKGELAHVGPERQMLQAKAAATKALADGAKLRLRQLEADRKQLELEVESKKTLIEKYANQQFQTRKNEEYRALAHEIENCRKAIHDIEDKQLGVMEQTEVAQKEAAAATKQAEDLMKVVEKQVADLGARETNLTKELAELEKNRGEFAAAVEETARTRYERLMKTKGDKVLVGIAHGVCGGCHMRIPAQSIVSCQGEKDLVSCPNCGRLLYYTRDMDLAVID